MKWKLTALVLAMVISLAGWMRAAEKSKWPISPENCLPVTVMKNTKRWELAKGSYRAEQVSGAIVVFALGENPSTGFRNRLACLEPAGSPPELLNLRKATSTIANPEPTPYATCASFPATEVVRHITIQDTDGTQVIEVEQVPN